MSTEETQNPRRKNKIPKQDEKLGRWGSLPRDLLIKIYEKLPFEELVAGPPLACRHWYAASLDPSLYRVFDIDNIDHLRRIVVPRGGADVVSVRFPFTMRESDFTLVADRCPNLKFFYLWCQISDESFRYAIRKWKGLEGMDVGATSLSWKNLKEIRSNCKNFVSLGFVAGTVSRYIASDIVHYLPKLKSINLLDCCNIRHNILLAMLDGCKELESLKITGSVIYNLDLKELQKFGTSLKSFQCDPFRWYKNY